MKHFMDNIYFYIKLINQIFIFIILLITVYSAIIFATLLPEISELGEEGSYENRGRID